MILEIRRENIKISLQGKIVRVPGEMFFPFDDKMGFAIDLKNLKHWDFPNANLELLTPIRKLGRRMSQLRQILAFDLTGIKIVKGSPQ